MYCIIIVTLCAWQFSNKKLIRFSCKVLENRWATATLVAEVIISSEIWLSY